MKKRMWWILFGILAFILTGCRTRELPASPAETGSELDAVSIEGSGPAYALSTKAVTTESHCVYVTLALAAPDYVDFSPLLHVGAEEELLFQGLLAIPSATGIPANVSYEIMDDGDGQNHTLDVIFKITPVIPEGGESAFGPGKTCSISFDSIAHYGYNPETNAPLPKSVLAEGPWQFEVALAESNTEAIQLLNAPIAAPANVTRIGETELDLIITQETITVTSIELRPLSLTITFEPPPPLNTFDCLYMDENIHLVTKDGSKIGYFQGKGEKEIAFLQAERPVSMDDADYIQLSDSTKIPISFFQ